MTTETKKTTTETIKNSTTDNTVKKRETENVAGKQENKENKKETVKNGPVQERRVDANPKTENAKREIDSETKSDITSEPAPKKPEKKKQEKKREVSADIILEIHGKQIRYQDIETGAKWSFSEFFPEDELKELKVYINTEECAAYVVANKNLKYMFFLD